MVPSARDLALLSSGVSLSAVRIQAISALAAFSWLTYCSCVRLPLSHGVPLSDLLVSDSDFSSTLFRKADSPPSDSLAFAPQNRQWSAPSLSRAPQLWQYPMCHRDPCSTSLGCVLSLTCELSVFLGLPSREKRETERLKVSESVAVGSESSCLVQSDLLLGSLVGRRQRIHRSVAYRFCLLERRVQLASFRRSLLGY